MPIALTIAGSDSGGGAGVQADLKVFSALGVYGASAITAITAQNTLGVAHVSDVEASMVEAQIEAVLSDMTVAAVKTGMLATAGNVRAASAALRRHGVSRLVVDPVIRASDGSELLSVEGIEAMKRDLLPLAVVVTPNVPEAESLLGRTLSDDKDLNMAAEAFLGFGCRAVVIKGGHRAGPADDVFFDGTRFEVLHAERIDSPHTHGTGCAFSAAIAAELAKGTELLDAVRTAKAYITEAIRQAYSIGHGHSPVHHFFGLWPPPQ